MPRRIGAALLDGIQQELGRAEPRSALVRIEEALLAGTQIPEERALIYRMKGDAHYACFPSLAQRSVALALEGGINLRIVG